MLSRDRGSIPRASTLRPVDSAHRPGKAVFKKIMRYLSQTKRRSCVPIALINLQKWQGLSVTGKDFNYYAKLCRWDSSCDTGTPRRNLAAVLRKRCRSVTYQEFKSTIANGAAIVVSTYYPDGHGHTWLCIGTSNRFLGINYYKNKTIWPISYQEIAIILKYSYVWIFKC